MSSLSSFTNNNNHNMQTATTTTTSSLETLMSMTPLQVALMATVIYYTIMIVVSTISQLFGSSHNNNSNNNNTTTTIPVGQTNNTHQKYDYDVIVIGAGIVGCTVGGSLAQQGKKVLIIERDLNEPDRIVGELLQPGGVEKLKQLGFGECLEGIDSPYMNGYGVFYGNERVHLPYPNRDFMNNNNNNSPSTSEKYHGRSFHYGKFIMNLRRRAQSMGKDKQSQLTLIQGSVCGFLYSPLPNHTTTATTNATTNATTTHTATTANAADDKNNIVHGVQYVSSLDGNEKRSVTSALVIVANGAGSTFTKSLNQSETVIASCFVGLKLKNAAHLLPFQNHGNVFMVDPAPVLCYPISSTDVRVLIDFPGSVAPNLTDEKLPLFLKNNVCPSLPLSMHEPFIKTIEEGNIRCALNREMPANLEFSKRGVIMLGDALNTRHPLTGGGMTVAFGDVQVLSELLRDVSDLTDYDAIDQAMKILSHRRKRYASTINILANALYAIFAPGDNDPMRSYMKKAVFNYFQLGGICATGPVALLSGLTESYHILLTHFFSVAIVGCFYECWPLPTPRALWTSLKLIKSAAMIVGPLIAEEKCLPFLFPKSIFKR